MEAEWLAEHREINRNAAVASQAVMQTRLDQLTDLDEIAAYWEEVTNIRIWSSESDRSPVSVSVNGEQITIPRNQWFPVKRKFVHALNNAVIDTFVHEPIPGAEHLTQSVPSLEMRFPFENPEAHLQDAKMESQEFKALLESNMELAEKALGLQEELEAYKAANPGSEPDIDKDTEKAPEDWDPEEKKESDKAVEDAHKEAAYEVAKP